ncbi:MAG: hypothetical protein WB797_03785 [Nocardioides sp.]
MRPAEPSFHRDRVSTRGHDLARSVVRSLDLRAHAEPSFLGLGCALQL